MGYENTHATLIEEMVERAAQGALATLGMRLEALDPDRVVVATDVDQRLFQSFGVVHGGIYVLMAESAASVAAGLSVDVSKYLTLGMSINANHLRPVSSGTLRAIATPIHRGKSTHVYHIDVVDQDDRKVSVSRCTIAIRPNRRPTTPE